MNLADHPSGRISHWSLSSVETASQTGSISTEWCGYVEKFDLGRPRTGTTPCPSIYSKKDGSTPQRHDVLNDRRDQSSAFRLTRDQEGECFMCVGWVYELISRSGQLRSESDSWRGDSVEDDDLRLKEDITEDGEVGVNIGLKGTEAVDSATVDWCEFEI